jgi:hypothetical protein
MCVVDVVCVRSGVVDPALATRVNNAYNVRELSSHIKTNSTCVSQLALIALTNNTVDSVTGLVSYLTAYTTPISVDVSLNNFAVWVTNQLQWARECMCACSA